MRTPLLWVWVVVVVLPPSATSAWGQEPMPWLSDGRTCFCLRHDSGQFLRNCTGTKLGLDFYVTATCRGQDPAGPTSSNPVRPPWSVVQANDPGCDPCRPKTAPIVFPPRAPEQ